MNTDVDFKENLPHQEGIISELYQRPDETYFQELKDLESLLNTSNHTNIENNSTQSVERFTFVNNS